MKSRSISWIAAIWLVPLCLYGAPRIPKDDREVLEQLPARRASTRSKIGAPVGSKTLELPEAVSNAWRLVQASRAEADPRLLGRAQALLSTWWDLPTPPAEVRLLRATIRQSLHDFPAALSDLNILLQEDPQNAHP